MGLGMFNFMLMQIQQVANRSEVNRAHSKYILIFWLFLSGLYYDSNKFSIHHANRCTQNMNNMLNCTLRAFPQKTIIKEMLNTFKSVLQVTGPNSEYNLLTKHTIYKNLEYECIGQSFIFSTFPQKTNLKKIVCILFSVLCSYSACLYIVCIIYEVSLIF